MKHRVRFVDITMQNPNSVAPVIDIPPEHPAWPALQAILSPGENVHGTLQVDLDATLNFTNGLLVLTSGRLLAWNTGAQTWSEWGLQPELSLRLTDHAGLGTLELLDTHQRLAFWRFSLALNLQA